MLDNLKKDDRVVTSREIHGVITGFKKHSVSIKIAEKVELEFDRSAVS